MFPIPFCEYRRKRYAIKQAGGPKMVQGEAMTHAEHNPAEEHRRDDRQARERFAGHRIQLCVVEKHRPTAFHTNLYDNYLDDTIHQIDLMRFFCGEGTPVHTSFEMRDGKLVGALSVAALEGGGKAVVLTSLMAGAWQERVTLHGDGLTVDVDAFRELRVKYTDREEVYGQDRPARWLPESLERGFMGAIEHFFECVRQRQTPQTDGYDSARTQELLEAMVACAG